MKPLKQRETLETVFANVHYRKSEKETCLTCKNRIWVLLHDADGNVLGPAFRCPVLVRASKLSGNSLEEIFKQGRLELEFYESVKREKTQ